MADFIEIIDSEGDPIYLNKNYIIKVEKNKREGGTDIFVYATPDSRSYRTNTEYDILKTQLQSS